MRWNFRLASLGAAFVLIPLFFLLQHFADLWDQYNVSAYLTSSYGPTDLQPPDGFSGAPGDKVVVMAKMEKQDTSWVVRELPDWQHAIYTVDASHAPSNNLTTPANKGREAMAYLTYIVDHYDNLPAIITFIHPHRDGLLAAWHTDHPTHSNSLSLRALQLDFVKQNGYVNLRCRWNPGCLKKHRKNKHVTAEVWEKIFSGTSTVKFPSTEGNQAFANWAPQGRFVDGWDMKKAMEVMQACCAQFAVSKERVRERPRKDYELFRQWLLDTEKSDAKSGRVLEFLWHVIFGMDPV